MGGDHADRRGAEGTIANDLYISMRLRAVGYRPGDRDGISDVDVFVHRDDHFSDAIAIVEHRLHHAPGIVVVALLQADGDVGTHVDQGLDHVHLLDALETLADYKPFDQRRH